MSNSGTDDFEKALAFVLKWETVFQKSHYGDYAFAVAELDPDDPGGLTKFGLDARTHGMMVGNLTLEQAREIYRREYWEKWGCGKWPWPISLFIFDGNVCGFRQVTLWFQRLAGASVDGVWGPRTDLRVREWIQDEGVQECARQLIAAKADFFRELAKQPKRRKFLQGWLNRLADLGEVSGMDKSFCQSVRSSTSDIS
jgi:lysozyme family protein